MQSPDVKEIKDQKRTKEDFRHLIDSEEYQLKKRLPPRLPKRKNDVYVARKTNFHAQKARCIKLLDQCNEVFIHGLGVAVNRAINLALQLKDESVGTLEVSTHTSTVELVDDLEPENDDLEPESRKRHNSAVHIHVFRRETMEAEQAS